MKEIGDTVSGELKEMFSDFQQHVIGVPQVVPSFGNVTFDGPGANEDFGLAQVTGDPRDRYIFRTAPLRNSAVPGKFVLISKDPSITSAGADPVGGADSSITFTAGIDAAGLALPALMVRGNARARSVRDPTWPHAPEIQRNWSCGSSEECIPLVRKIARDASSLVPRDFMNGTARGRDTPRISAGEP